MVAASRDSTSSHQQHQQPPEQHVVSVEDEALKRNTDCVYFLASPLTCKKGIECEYRHSEEARMNPRDCYYWLNGNCLNPKCAFRHPPLDGLMGTQAVGSTGPSLPTSQTAVPLNANYNPGRQLAATSTPFYPGKQAVPCIFFFKGLCVKGDRCAFSHGLTPASNKFTREPAAAILVREPSNLKKTLGVLQKCSNEPKLPQANIQKPNHEVVFKVKPAPILETAISQNNNIGQKSALAPVRFHGEDSGHIDAHFSKVTNGNNTMVWSNHMDQPDVSDDQSLPNGSKDADDFYKESSPGFDVLVDDELRDSEYYHDEDQFGRQGHEGRNLAEFDVGGSSDYNRIGDVDCEINGDPRGYDSYNRKQGNHDWNQRRDEYLPDQKSSDPLERRGYVKSVSPNQIEESDLRYRLSKQRRVNGLKSVISHDYAHSNHDEERRYRDSGRDLRYLPSNERSYSSRLRGRISIPSRSNDNNVCSDRDLDRDRSFGRFSPGRSQSFSHQGRLSDRLKGRVQDDFHRRDRMSDARTDFSGPKSLAELKVSKNGERKEKQMEGQDTFSLGKRKHLSNHQASEEVLSFDGPKPLSEILKRKRGDIEPVTVVEDVNPTIETDSAHVESVVESHVIDDTTTFEPEEGFEEDQYDPEAYDQNDAGLDEGGYNLEEGDIAYEEEEYYEEEDEAEDFSKNIGAVLS